jgi:hypothetical protein
MRELAIYNSVAVHADYSLELGRDSCDAWRA